MTQIGLLHFKPIHTVWRISKKCITREWSFKCTYFLCDFKIRFNTEGVPNDCFSPWKLNSLCGKCFLIFRRGCVELKWNRPLEKEAFWRFSPPEPYGPGPFIIWKNFLNQICFKTIFEMHTAPGACVLYAPGSVCFLNMVLEHIKLRIFFKIIKSPEL